MENTENIKIKVIDPPSGWKYGFPKEIPNNIESKDVYKWLVDGKHFYCGYWGAVKTDNVR